MGVGVGVGVALGTLTGGDGEVVVSCFCCCVGCAASPGRYSIFCRSFHGLFSQASLASTNTSRASLRSGPRFGMRNLRVTVPASAAVPCLTSWPFTFSRYSVPGVMLVSSTGTSCLNVAYG